MFAQQRHLAKQSGLLAGLALFLLTLPGCQSITDTPVSAQVRVIDASPDSPGMDIYQGTGVIAYNLGFGTSTSYVPLTPGSYTIAADRANSAQQLISASGTFSGATQHTVVIGNYAATLQEQVLADQAVSAPAGQASFRFLDQAPAAGPIDLYLVSSSGTLATTKPLATGVTFNGNTGYLNVATGTYTLVALASGTTPTNTSISLVGGSSNYYATGAVRTVVLINNVQQTTPALLATILSDYN